jgi:hypothetical protein
MNHHYDVRREGRARRRDSQRLAWIVVTVVWSGAVVTGGGQDAGHMRSVLDGVYTGVQAGRGEAAYTAQCARCHRDDLRGNPEAMPLTGTHFTETWREDTLFSLFDHMATRMPREPRTTLPTPVYVDILAFILRFNGYPAGEQELTADNLTAVYFVDKNGPQPLPNLAIVRVVGCLTPGERGVWMLTHTTRPVRDRAGRETTPEQLRASAAVSLAAGSFQLQNLEDLRQGFRPELLTGAKVQVKGALVRRPTDERIAVTSLDTVAASCP